MFLVHTDTCKPNIHTHKINKSNLKNKALKLNKAGHRFGDTAQLVKRLPSIPEVLGSIPSTAKARCDSALLQSQRSGHGGRRARSSRPLSATQSV